MRKLQSILLATDFEARLALIGAVFFGIALGRFRKTIGSMA
jgi:hypothetical protein